MKLCTACGESKAEAEFSVKSKQTGKLQARCKLCHTIYRKQHYLDNHDKYREMSRRYNLADREWKSQNILKYLIEHPCMDCGETDPVVLQFDHLRDKVANIGAMIRILGASWKTIKEEIDKCEVVCANCHTRRTAKRAGWDVKKCAEALIGP